MRALHKSQSNGHPGAAQATDAVTDPQPDPFDLPISCADWRYFCQVL